MRTPERNTIFLYCLPEEKHLVLKDIKKWSATKGNVPIDVSVGDLRRYFPEIKIQPIDVATNICAVYFGTRDHVGGFEGVRIFGLEKFLIGF